MTEKTGGRKRKDRQRDKLLEGETLRRNSKEKKGMDKGEEKEEKCRENVGDARTDII